MLNLEIGGISGEIKKMHLSKANKTTLSVQYSDSAERQKDSVKEHSDQPCPTY